MKKFIFFAIFLLFYPLFATNTTQLAQKLQKILCPKETIIECDKDTYLTYSDYTLLDNDKLLIFFNLVSPNSIPYTSGNNNIGVIFDAKGEWRVSEILEGSINHISRDPQGGIWISHPWVIEGTSPALSYNKNAKEWKSISFPTKRPFSSIESMEFCLLPKTIMLAFEDYNGKHTYWQTTYRDALKTTPHWKAISSAIYHHQRCLEAKEINSHWYERIELHQLSFYNSSTKVTTTIPDKIPLKSPKISQLPYTIQIGYFHIKKSMEHVKKSLNKVSGYILHSKQLSSGDYKLFLGSFKTKKMAQKGLKSLKKRYPNNRYIQEAFIVKLP